MIAYVKGEIAFKSPTQVIIDVGGLGYAVKISLYTYARIEKQERTKLFTYYHVNTQDMRPSLYGFADELERSIFLHLIAVKGISVNSARVILSSMTPEEVRVAVVSENEIAFKKVKGVGAKTAKQIILDLKDKLVKESGDAPVEMAPANNAIRQEALSALTSLMVPKIQAQKVLNKILREDPSINSVETLIKLALKQLG